MDLILQDSVLRLSKALGLERDVLLSCETAENLVILVRQQLALELPETPWSLQYALEQTTGFSKAIEADYYVRQRQYSQILGLSDATGLMKYVKHLLLLDILRLASLRQYDSVEHAAEIKVLIRRQVDQVMLDCSDAMYALYRDWKVILIEAIEYQEETLPHIVYIRRAESLPALVIAYDLYEDLARENDILKRNGIVHPTFCPAGMDLEVLSE